TGRAPPTRSTEHDRSRVSLRYSPRPRESEWMSPNWSVSRKMLPCLRTWTLPRSVAFSMGPTRGSKKRMLSAGACWTASRRRALLAAVAAAAAVASAATRCCVSRAIVGSGDARQSVGLVRLAERVDQAVEVAVHDPRQRRQVELDPVVGQAVLGEVVGPDLLGSVTGLDHRSAGRGVGF